MFASGVVKLTSRCPAWWGLTGEGPRLDMGHSWRLCPALTAHRHLQPSPTTTRHSACPHLPPGLPTTCPSGCTGSVWWPPSSLRSRCPLCSSPRLAAYAWLPSTARWVGTCASGRQGHGFLPHNPVGPVRDRVAASSQEGLRQRNELTQHEGVPVGRAQPRWRASVGRRGAKPGCSPGGAGESRAGVEDRGSRARQRPRGAEEGRGACRRGLQAPTGPGRGSPVGL